MSASIDKSIAARVGKRSREGSSETASGTQSIHRAARILREIASYSLNGLRLVDLARQLDLNRTTIHRILNCLIEEGLVMQNLTSRRYVLGHGLFELGLTAASQFKLREICGPSLERIAAETGHTAFMTIRSNYDALSIQRVDGTTPLDIPALDIGVHRPLGVGAGSLAILSALADDEIERIVSANARRLAGFGKLTVPLLLEIARQSREAGYGIHDGRMIAGISGVGVLVHDGSGAPLGAISISAKADCLPLKAQGEIVLILKKEARAIQNLLHQANFDMAEYNRQYLQGKFR
ncbi:DNA-binding IclR family transcriptional regulator [Massilia sp. UYP11]|uniref:IclR family transcriptional regulator n=1 Tax=Massilia sp. UYP11 TaxID=1756385 RepID=UPI003D262097